VDRSASHRSLCDAAAGNAEIVVNQRPSRLIPAYPETVGGALIPAGSEDENVVGRRGTDLMQIDLSGISRLTRHRAYVEERFPARQLASKGR
jgi:hypothetical protein